MSGYYKEREIKFIESTYHYYDDFGNKKTRVEYEIRAYDEDGTYEVLVQRYDLGDIFRGFN